MPEFLEHRGIFPEWISNPNVPDDMIAAVDRSRGESIQVISRGERTIEVRGGYKFIEISMANNIPNPIFRCNPRSLTGLDVLEDSIFYFNIRKSLGKNKGRR
jgi:hypothetical protein